jgi:hypothetical protein
MDDLAIEKAVVAGADWGSATWTRFSHPLQLRPAAQDGLGLELDGAEDS